MVTINGYATKLQGVSSTKKNPDEAKTAPAVFAGNGFPFHEKWGLDPAHVPTIKFCDCNVMLAWKLLT